MILITGPSLYALLMDRDTASATSRYGIGQCSRKRVQPLKKRKKARFSDFQKKLKTLKKRDHLVMQPLITQLPEIGTGKSRSPTSNILLRSVDTRNYATENCV